MTGLLLQWLLSHQTEIQGAIKAGSAQTGHQRLVNTLAASGQAHACFPLSLCFFFFFFFVLCAFFFFFSTAFKSTTAHGAPRG
jgi:hypothetical protein